MFRLANVVIPPLPEPLTYAVPAQLRERVQIGSRVEVPLGRRTAIGFVVSGSEQDFENISPPRNFKVKPLSGSEISYCFNSTQLKLFQWVSTYYRVPLSSVIETAVPTDVPRRFHRTAALIAEQKPPPGRLQRQIVRFLEQQSGQRASVEEIARRFKGASASLRRMKERGFIEIHERELLDHHVIHSAPPEWTKSEVSLDSDQTAAAEHIISAASEKKFQPFLLHGVTGSGKTEVYLEAIRAVHQHSRGSLVIVPEIALTPQLLDRFRARLGNQIAVIHSGLSRRARWDAWRALLEKRSFVAIGARSAIFAPIPELGLIIVDEEHDPSFKQSDGLRYNARDLALVRAKLSGCPVVLGSATPSLESYYHAKSGKYELLELPGRHESGSKIDYSLVNLNEVPPWEMYSKNISPPLFEAVSNALQSRQQIFILYNRRGFASFLHCERCETALECPNCTVTLTYHQKRNSLRCHYCNLSLHPPEFCSKCQTSSDNSNQQDDSDETPPRLTPRGAGTERIVDELAELFPEASIDRLDRDTASSAEDYQAILNRVRTGESDILVGTQMIAKGHDLPGVTVVGVIDCDVGLHMPDFRASERVYQLLTQVSGRCGRAELPGMVILQTRVPHHRALTCTLQQDFQGFASDELQSRASLGYPPFRRMLRIVISSQKKHYPEQLLNDYAFFLRKNTPQLLEQVQILGPSPAPLEKLRTLWRWHLLVKSQGIEPLHAIIDQLKQIKLPSSSVRVAFDLDPQDML